MAANIRSTSAKNATRTDRNAKFRIRTGGLDVEVEAQDHQQAACKALRDYSADAYGLITEVTLVGGDPDKDGWYLLTERVLQDAGINYRMKDGREKFDRKTVVAQ